MFVCMSVCGYVYVNAVPVEGKQGTGSLEAPSGTRNWTQAPCQSSTLSQSLDHVFSPSDVFWGIENILLCFNTPIIFSYIFS